MINNLNIVRANPDNIYNHTLTLYLIHHKMLMSLQDEYYLPKRPGNIVSIILICAKMAPVSGVRYDDE